MGSGTKEDACREEETIQLQHRKEYGGENGNDLAQYDVVVSAGTPRAALFCAGSPVSEWPQEMKTASPW
jgi:hypothetical protein